MKYCYIRVSTDKQDFLRQKKILQDKGYYDSKDNCIYINEIYTGTTKKRPKLQELLKNLKEQDTIISCELSRISRSVKDFRDLVDEILFKKKANLIIIKENFNLYANKELDAMTKLILNVTASFAEFQRDIISDNTKDGLRARKANGVIIGHPRTKKATETNFIKTLEVMINNNVGQNKATLRTGYPRDTFSRDLKKCYEKYNTKDYETILLKVRSELA